VLTGVWATVAVGIPVGFTLAMEYTTTLDCPPLPLSVTTACNVLLVTTARVCPPRPSENWSRSLGTPPTIFTALHVPLPNQFITSPTCQGTPPLYPVAKALPENTSARQTTTAILHILR